LHEIRAGPCRPDSGATRPGSFALLFDTDFYPTRPFSTRLVQGKLSGGVKYRELIKLLESAGWRLERMGKGDHIIYRHPDRSGPVVVAGGGKLNRDVPKGTQNAILRQAGLK